MKLSETEAMVLPWLALAAWIALGVWFAVAWFQTRTPRR